MGNGSNSPQGEDGTNEINNNKRSMDINCDAMINKSMEDKHSLGLERLRIPPNDPRRYYLNTIFQCSNSCDFVTLSRFMHAHATDDFTVICSGKNPLLSFTDSKAHLPQSVTIVGVDAYINLNSSMGECVPDRYYSITETIIRNSLEYTIIMSKYVLTGTLVYKVNPPNKSVLGSKMLVKETSYKPNFAGGSVAEEESTTMTLEGTATCQLDKHGKIQRLCFDYTHLRNRNWIKLQKKKLKTSASSSPSSN